MVLDLLDRLTDVLGEIMPKENGWKFYDALRKKECGDVVDSGPLARIRRKVIIGMLKKYSSKNSRILDAGCGRGNLLIEMEKCGFTALEGSDFSEGSLVVSKNRFKGRVFRADLSNLNDFSGSKYDTIVCSEVLEHITDDLSAIRNLNSLLAPGGILLISVPFNMRFWSHHDVFAGHMRRYSDGELEEKLIKCGFRIIEKLFQGGILYGIYNWVLTGKDPASLRSSKRTILKKVASRVIYRVLLLEFWVNSPRLGKRLFVVAKKK